MMARMSKARALVYVGTAALLGANNGALGIDIDVQNPGAVMLDRAFSLEWTSLGANNFDVELFINDGDCSGKSPLDLCGKPGGCHDSQGDLNIKVPMSAGEGFHSIRLSLHGDSKTRGCTGAFIATEDAPEGSAAASLEVATLDFAGDVPTGMNVVVEWKYDDGRGSTEGRFSIDLYKGADCKGAPVADLCGKANSAGTLIGCSDTSGDYPVTIPTDLLSGQYSIKVAVFGHSHPAGCSPPFAVKSSAAGVWDYAQVGVETLVPTPWTGYLMTKEPCDPLIPVEVRWSQASHRVYFEHTDGTFGGCATLSQLLEIRKEKNGTVKGPLYPLDPVTNAKLTNATVTGHWLIEADLYVTHGITLQLHGLKSGGDCDTLRIKSTDTEFFNLRGHGGNLDFIDTVITSWDTDRAVPGVRDNPDHNSLEDDTIPRSYINCLSEVITDETETCFGSAKADRGECRMDIVRSEIGYLGYYGVEAYGLTWKVRGFCEDKSNPEVFDVVNTYGDVIGSNIHHLFYGLYTYGHLGGLWIENEMHDNEWYGFDPHDDSDYLTIHNNLVWNNGRHGIIASKRCDHVSIQNNEVWNGGVLATGIFLHRSSDSAIVKGNHVYDMQDSGLAALESFDIIFANNLIERCRYGVRLSLGSGDNWVVGNTFTNIASYGFFTYIGSNLPEVAPYDGFRVFNTIIDSNFIDTWHMGKLKEADFSIVTSNVFTSSASISLAPMMLEIDNSTETQFSENVYPETAIIDVKNGACFMPGSDLSPVCV